MAKATHSRASRMCLIFNRELRFFSDANGRFQAISELPATTDMRRIADRRLCCDGAVAGRHVMH